MILGFEQIYNPNYSVIEKLYIAIFGMPIIGLRIRARNVFSLIPTDKLYRNILDAGSGPGVFSFELARRFPAANVLGVDLQSKSIKACKKIAEKISCKNVRFSQIAVEEINASNSFDLIICIDILEHVVDDDGFLSKLSDYLTPNGVLILHVPALYRRYPVWKKSLNFDVESHIRPGYEKEPLKEKVKKCELFIMNSGYTYGFFETLANNISYMITHAKMERKILYSMIFPFLNLLSIFGAKARPKTLGAGIYIVAKKQSRE